MMIMSVEMNFIIPLLCHFMHIKNVENTQDFILSVYDCILESYETIGIDILSKLYETALSNITRTAKRNQVIWNMQDIRGLNTNVHTAQSINNIIINIMPKYRYDGNLVHLNYKSIQRNTGFQIIDIEYEFNFVSLSSSRRDEDYNSEIDKYESLIAKADEGLAVLNDVAAADAVEQIKLAFGPVDSDEIHHYKKGLSDGKKVCIINLLQKQLTLNLFYKFFGDTTTANSINLDDYVTLIICAKRFLIDLGMMELPYIIGSNVVRLANRKSVNKKELMKVTSSPLWKDIQEKYNHNKRIEDSILSIIGTILSSSFKIIDYNDDYLDGRPLALIPDIICDEILRFALLI